MSAMASERTSRTHKSVLSLRQVPSNLFAILAGIFSQNYSVAEIQIPLQLTLANIQVKD